MDRGDNWMVYTVAFAILLGYGVYWCSQNSACEARGGVLVSSPGTWGGYACVEKR